MSRYIIPPLSVVRLALYDSSTPDWKKQIGRTFRVGYYSRKDGTDCVWLVNDAGEYGQTVEQNWLSAYFDVIERSGERALFGRNRAPVAGLKRSPRTTSAIAKVNGIQHTKSPMAAGSRSAPPQVQVKIVAAYKPKEEVE